jgi:mRNA deadenylase 3'-5' endonuclease subunit Ccr4
MTDTEFINIQKLVSFISLLFQSISPVMLIISICMSAFALWKLRWLPKNFRRFPFSLIDKTYVKIERNEIEAANLITVVSYNIMSYQWIESQNYSEAQRSNRFLLTSERAPKILLMLDSIKNSENNSYKNSRLIICLQECDLDLWREYYGELLDVDGYEIHIPKDAKKVTNITLFQSEYFHFVKSEVLYLDGKHKKTEDQPCAFFVELRCKRTKSQLLVINTQLYKNELLSNVETIHRKGLLRNIIDFKTKKYPNYSNQNFFICGEFGLDPETALKIINNRTDDVIENVLTLDVRSASDLEQLTPEEYIKRRSSGYSSIEYNNNFKIHEKIKNKIPYKNYDYIFYNNDDNRIEIIALYNIMIILFTFIAFAKCTSELPNDDHGSHHLPIVARFRINKK